MGEWLNQIELYAFKDFVQLVLGKLKFKGDTFENISDNVVREPSHFRKRQILQRRIGYLKYLLQNRLYILHHRQIRHISAIQLPDLTRLFIGKLARYPIKLLTRTHVHVNWERDEALYHRLAEQLLIDLSTPSHFERHHSPRLLFILHLIQRHNLVLIQQKKIAATHSTCLLNFAVLILSQLMNYVSVQVTQELGIRALNRPIKIRTLHIHIICLRLIMLPEGFEHIDIPLSSVSSQEIALSYTLRR